MLTRSGKPKPSRKGMLKSVICSPSDTDLTGEEQKQLEAGLELFEIVHKPIVSATKPA